MRIWRPRSTAPCRHLALQLVHQALLLRILALPSELVWSNKLKHERMENSTSGRECFIIITKNVLFRLQHT
jgi:hypothetical protein